MAEPELVTVEGMRALLQRPSTEQPAPGVIVLHELFGLNDDIRSILHSFAQHGYVGLAPDLYSGHPRPLCIARTVMDSVRTGGRDSADRVEKARRRLAAQPEVFGDRIGVIGFCLSGGIALLAAARGDFQVASVNYGEVPEDTSRLEGICPLVGSYGALDKRLLPAAQRLEQALTEFDVPHDVEVYDDAGHSFLNRSGPAFMRRLTSVGYQPDQAEHAWNRIFAFFDTYLQD